MQPFLVKKQIVSILQEWSPPNAEVFVVSPPGGALVPRTRVFIDMLLAWFDKHERDSQAPTGVWAERRARRAANAG